MGKAVASINLSSGVEANNNARQVATNYLASDDTGIMVAELSGSSETPSTATGNNVRITSTSVDVRKGQYIFTTMSQDGLSVYNGSGSPIAHLGYGSTQSQLQIENRPYYDLGERASGTTIGAYSTIAGYGNTANNLGAFAEGLYTTAGVASHAEGDHTTANNSSHAEGVYTTASGGSSHAEGNGTEASGTDSHAEGLSTVASGAHSHAQGYGCVVAEDNGTVLGKFNSATTGYSVVVGGGTSNNARADILKVDWSGNVTASGSVSQKKASFDGTAAGVSGFWNSAITTRSDAYLERIGNTVYFYLRFTSPITVTSGQNICTIPDGYRPTHICHYSTTVAWENNNNSPISVSTNGVVAFINQAFSASKSYILCATWLTENTFP